MPEDKPTRDPKLVAVEAELASDRGEITDPTTERFHEVVTLGKPEDDLGHLIADAEDIAEGKSEKKAWRSKPRFGWLKKLFAFGPWKPKPEPKKDYKLEFDPKTGGERRVYMVRDGRTDRED